MKSIQGQVITAIADALIQLGQSLKEIVFDEENVLTKEDYLRPTIRESKNKDLQQEETRETAKDYLTVNELKEYLHVGTGTAYKLAQRRDFPKVMLGNKSIFPRKAVDEWMEKEATRGTLPRKLRGK